MPLISLVVVLLCSLGAEGLSTGHVPSHLAPLRPLPPPSALTAQQVWRWREDTRGMLRHAYGSYMRHAYPADELKPLSCVGREWDRRERGTLDDCLGGYSLTLIDSLSTLALTGDLPAFRRGVARVVAEVRLDRDVLVSVFEANIRVLGGLLSAHQLASDPLLRIFDSALHCGPDAAGAVSEEACTLAMCGPQDDCAAESSDGPATCPCLLRYNGELLAMAIELGTRLLPAFDTPTGLPVHRVNLATGAQDPNARQTCAAAAGTFLLEFGLLSRLSGDPIFEAVARRATAALWSRRSPLQLVPSGVNTHDGTATAGHTGIGAGVDSFLEYLLKAGVLLDDDALMRAHAEAADAVSEHMLLGPAGVHFEVSLSEGRRQPRHPVLSSLAAFWPGLEVLAGEVEAARAHLRPLLSLAAKHGVAPELYDVQAQGPVHFAKDAPLRPELLESVYHVFSATRDHALLHASGTLVTHLQKNARVACGFASIADVTTGRLDDRMDSYVIAETLLYAFLTFDVALRHWYDGPPLRDELSNCDDNVASPKCRANLTLKPPSNGSSPSLDDFGVSRRQGHGDSRPVPVQNLDADCECFLRRQLHELPRSTGTRNATPSDGNMPDSHVAAVSISSDGRPLPPVPATPAIVPHLAVADAASHVDAEHTLPLQQSAQCFYFCAARRRLSGAHPLFFRRSGGPHAASANGTSGSEPAPVMLPSLVLPHSDSHAVFTTEGHPLLLWPELLSGRPLAAAADVRFSAQRSHTRASTPPSYSWVHRGGLPRPIGSHSADFLPWGYSRRRAPLKNASRSALAPTQHPLPRELHVSVPPAPVTLAHSTCRVARLRGAVAAYASNPPPSHPVVRLAIDDGRSPPKRERDVYPWRGSADIIPSTEEGRSFDALYGRAMLVSYGLATSASAQLSAAVQAAVRSVHADLSPTSGRGDTINALKAGAAAAAAPQHAASRQPLPMSTPRASPTPPQRSLSGALLSPPPKFPVVGTSVASLADARLYWRSLSARALLIGNVSASGVAVAPPSPPRILTAPVAVSVARQMFGASFDAQRERLAALVIALHTGEEGDLSYEEEAGVDAENGGVSSSGAGEAGGDAAPGECLDPSLAAESDEGASFDTSFWGEDSRLTDVSFVPAAWLPSRMDPFATVPIDAQAYAAALNEVPVLRSALHVVLMLCETLQRSSCTLATATASDAPPIAVHVRYKAAPGEGALGAAPTPCECGMCSTAPAADAAPPSPDAEVAGGGAHPGDAASAPSPALGEAWAAHDVLHPPRAAAPSGAAPPPPAAASLFLHAAGAQFGPLLTGAGIHGLEPVLASPLGACGPVELRRAPVVEATGALLPVVALALRGGCTFAEKARHAQAAGASALLVLDVDVGAGFGEHEPPTLLSPAPGPAAGAKEAAGAPRRALFDPYTATMAGGGGADDSVGIPAALLAGAQLDCLLSALAIRAAPLQGGAEPPPPKAPAPAFPVLGAAELHAFRRDQHHALAPSRPARVCLFNPADRGSLPPRAHAEGAAAGSAAVAVSGHSGFTLGGALRAPGLLPPPVALIAELARSLLLQQQQQQQQQQQAAAAP